MIEQMDYLVRTIAIGAGLMLLSLIVANDVRARIKLPLAGLIIGAIGYLINSKPMMMGTGPLNPFIDMVSISTPFWVWLFARRLFEREPERRVLMIVISVLLFGWFVGNFLSWTWPAGFLLIHFVLLGLIGDLVRVGVLEREDDLIEQRRIIRLWLPLLVAAQAGGVLIFELFELAFDGLDDRPPIVRLINAVLILLLILFAGLALLRTDPELLIKAEPSEPPEDQQALDLSPPESVLHQKLTAAMADGLYREAGLSIAALADHLGTPEHRLRALINQRMGYRNFSAFLNHYRIAEACEKLASRDNVDLPVLTIAMDLGYNSLPTFNRAFRSETGTTPSEFRKRAIAQSAQVEAVQE